MIDAKTGTTPYMGQIMAEKCLGGPVRMVAAYGSRSPAAVVYWFRPATQQKKEE